VSAAFPICWQHNFIGAQKTFLAKKSVPQAEFRHSASPAAPRRRGNLYVTRRSNAVQESEKRAIEPVALLFKWGSDLRKARNATKSIELLQNCLECIASPCDI
jgi:hypothetical protein